MVTDIGGLTPKSSHELRSSGNGTKSSDLKADSTNTPNSTPSADDKVLLSSEAQTLKKLESALDQQPEVNQQKVDEVKAALESGNYQIDDLVVADRLLEIDSLFG